MLSDENGGRNNFTWSWSWEMERAEQKGLRIYLKLELLFWNRPTFASDIYILIYWWFYGHSRNFSLLRKILSELFVYLNKFEITSIPIYWF